MSDEDSYHYSDMSDNDDGGAEESFEYTDDEDDIGPDGATESDNIEIQLENAYYNAKGQRDTDIDEAFGMFEDCIALEHKDGYMGNSWTFKCLKQMMKIKLTNQEYTVAQGVYKRLLECITDKEREGISHNAMEKGINGMLDRVSGLFQGDNSYFPNSDAQMEDTEAPKGKPHDLARYVYDSTLLLFHPTHGACPNERLWFKTNLKYGQLLYENYETDKLEMVIQDLLSTSQASSATNGSSSATSTQLMEIYALQIQLYSRLKDNKKLREIFDKAMNVHGGIPHPRTIALIQELGGKMHAESGDFEAANTAFFQAFKSYDEAGDNARLRCLKYLVIASMLHASTINPFDSQEVRSYKNDPEIVAMTNLVDAFHSNDIQKFESILSKNEGTIMNDEFIRDYISDLLRTIRTQVLVQFLQPYTRISLNALSKALNNISIKDIESLLVPLILDGKLDGRIDQVNGILYKLGPNDREGKGEKEGATSTVFGGNTSIARTCDTIESLLEELENMNTNFMCSIAQLSYQGMQGSMKRDEYIGDFEREHRQYRKV